MKIEIKQGDTISFKTGYLGTTVKTVKVVSCHKCSPDIWLIESGEFAYGNHHITVVSERDICEVK